MTGHAAFSPDTVIFGAFSINRSTLRVVRSRDTAFDAMVDKNTTPDDGQCKIDTAKRAF